MNRNQFAAIVAIYSLAGVIDYNASRIWASAMSLADLTVTRTLVPAHASFVSPGGASNDIDIDLIDSSKASRFFPSRTIDHKKSVKITYRRSPEPTERTQTASVIRWNSDRDGDSSALLTVQGATELLQLIDRDNLHDHTADSEVSLKLPTLNASTTVGIDGQITALALYFKSAHVSLSGPAIVQFRSGLWQVLKNS